MKYIFGIIGGYIGALIDSFSGFFFGAAIGFLFGYVIELKKVLHILEDKVSVI
ncbi:MAG: fructose-specific phosphotransferase system IIC component [Gammaproteobacteria bacterium]|jgi:fructose-specific phosphotransferase system IIC component